MGNTFGNHTTFGFSHDSLNSLNSGKVIEEKLHWHSCVVEGLWKTKPKSRSLGPEPIGHVVVPLRMKLCFTT